VVELLEELLPLIYTYLAGSYWRRDMSISSER